MNEQIKSKLGSEGDKHLGILLKTVCFFGGEKRKQTNYLLLIRTEIQKDYSLTFGQRGLVFSNQLSSEKPSDNFTLGHFGFSHMLNEFPYRVSENIV